MEGDYLGGPYLPGAETITVTLSLLGGTLGQLGGIVMVPDIGWVDRQPRVFLRVTPLATFEGGHSCRAVIAETRVGIDEAEEQGLCYASGDEGARDIIR